MRHDIVQRQDSPNVAVCVDDRKASDSMRFHGAESGRRLVVCQTRVHRALGHFADRDTVGRAASRREGDTDVPVGDHAGDPALIVDDR